MSNKGTYYVYILASGAVLFRLVSHRRQHLVAAIIGVEFSTALLSDRGASRRGRSVGGNTERAAQSIGGPAGLACGKGCAGSADAEHQQCGGGDLDHQSHGASSPKTIAISRLSTSIIAPKYGRGCRQIGPVLA